MTKSSTKLHLLFLIHTKLIRDLDLKGKQIWRLLFEMKKKVNLKANDRASNSNQLKRECNDISKPSSQITISSVKNHYFIFLSPSLLSWAQKEKEEKRIITILFTVFCHYEMITAFIDS